LAVPPVAAGSDVGQEVTGPVTRTYATGIWTYRHAPFRGLSGAGRRGSAFRLRAAWQRFPAPAGRALQLRRGRALHLRPGGLEPGQRS
ncbi:hypothetical protein, partial [Streptomyces sp. NPDC093544]|uniref:hypothetical protein n=1 Tax=Streptomyces sp. NPDC093544 TaxID=3155200 RepID=UPI00341763AE